MKKILLFLLVLMIFLCADDKTSSNTYESYNEQIIINNIPLSYNIKILGSNSRFIADLLDARVEILNRSKNRHYLEYKFIWYDSSGFEMAKYLSKWKRIRIDGSDKVVIKDLAISPKIDSFKFYIRGLDDQ